MSRRDSRAHLTERQNDALLEFENFKRKYLLVNKHITKLNSTLSVRVEDLNSQVSTLYAENLRLRASEISLVSQLKKEKKKSQKIMEQAESVVEILMDRLDTMRNTMGRNKHAATPSPTMKRKLHTSPVQPPREVTRLAQPPDTLITEIRETEEEAEEEEEEEEDTAGSDTPTRALTARPLSSNGISPKSALVIASVHPDLPPQIDLTHGTAKKRLGPRTSSLLVVEHPRDAAERVGSPGNGPARRTRRQSLEDRRNSLGDEEREVELQIQPVESTAGSTVSRERSEGVAPVPALDNIKLQVVLEKTGSPARKSKNKQTMIDWTRYGENQSASEKESSESSKEKERRRFGIKDVTNSPRKLPSDFVVDEPLGISDVTPKPDRTQTFETPPPNVLPPSRLSNASTPATDNGSDTGEIVNGRERRSRKSVNYAEPKLNTKMRKPDPPPDSVRPRTSTGAATARRRKSIPALNIITPSDDDGDADAEGAGPKPRLTEIRRKTMHSTAANLSGSLAHAPTMDIAPPVRTESAYGAWAAETRRHSTIA